jgi:PadR family transcriptional regulator PadR
MSEEKSEFLKGTLDMLILKVVALGPIHGYAIAQRMQQISRDFFQLQQGSLYPALHRLEDRGWLKAEWKASETGREAKFYALTPKGRRQLEAEVKNWEQLTDAKRIAARRAALQKTLARSTRRHSG